MIKVLYSFNKKGDEAHFWAREIAAASTPAVQFLPFNHDPYLDVRRYWRAQLLDDLYYDDNDGLLRLYGDVTHAIRKQGIDALVVDNGPPYHPEFLLTLDTYKVLRTTDGPIAAYDRDFAYLHAYDHVVYHSPAYSRDLGMAEKLRYCGARRIDFWPLAVFDQAFDPNKTEAELVSQPRDIDIIFIGAMHVNKMPLLARVKREFGSRCVLRGLTSFKRNLYFNSRFGPLGWVRAIPLSGYVPLYQRAKIGFNIHNRGDYTVGSYRLFDLPANGVMQISDGGSYLEAFFENGREIVGYAGGDDLLAKIEFYLTHPADRTEIAIQGYRRAVRDHRFRHRMQQLGELILSGMGQKMSTRAPIRQE